jgi:cystathionine beta-synthase
MTVFESVGEAIGNTPLIRLRTVGQDLAAPIYAKVEFLSVGGSVKDRAALAMVESAERDGSLKPGGTIVEATSGNTGIGLAIIGRQRGYRVIVGISDRSAPEKVDILKAYGAEVVIAPAALPKQHPEHLFNVVRRLVEEIPGAWLANQYDNPANPDAHRRTTGPEIWAQTEGRVTHFVAGIGTGGTISGAGGYLHDVSGGSVTVVGADPEASVYAGGDGSPYFVESIGHFVHPDTAEDLWPESYHRDVVDRFERIPDRESLLTARRLARDEGLLAGPSSGTAVAAAIRVARDLGPNDLVVVLLPDSGRSYLSKIFNDDWLRRWGFLEEPAGVTDGGPAVRDLLDRRPRLTPPLATVSSDDSVGRVIDDLQGIWPAVPVILARDRRPHGIAASEIVGAIDIDTLSVEIAGGRVNADSAVLDHVDDPLPTVGIGQSVAEAYLALGDQHRAAVVLEDGRAVGLVTRAELTGSESAVPCGSGPPWTASSPAPTLGRMTDSSDVAQRYRRRADAFQSTAAAVPSDRWSAPSPCADWDARGVLGHIVDMHAAMLAPLGRSLSPAPSLEEDPVAAFISARADVEALLDDPATSSREIGSPMGPTTVERHVDEVASADMIVHRWDLARAAGLDDTIDPAEVDAMLPTAESMPEVMRTPGAFGPDIVVFGPLVELPPDASKQDRLLGLLGRDPR